MRDFQIETPMYSRMTPFWLAAEHFGFYSKAHRPGRPLAGKRNDFCVAANGENSTIEAEDYNRVIRQRSKLLAQCFQCQSQPIPTDGALRTCVEFRLGHHPRQQSPVLPSFVNPAHVSSRPEGTAAGMLIETPDNPGRALLQRFYSARQLEMYFGECARRCQNAGEEHYFAGVGGYDGTAESLRFPKSRLSPGWISENTDCGIGLKAQAMEAGSR